MPISLTIESKDLRAALSNLGTRTADLRWLWPDMAGEFYKREQDLFAGEGLGEWIALSPNYAKWKSKHYPGQPLLALKGDLRRSLGNRFSPDAVFEPAPLSLTLGTTVRYALAHQYGYPSRNLPARPPIVIDSATEAKMLDVAERNFASYCETLGFGTTRN